MEKYLLDGERLDDLEYNDMYIISNKDKYCFTSDSVMLANMVKANSSDTVVDFCTGGGIIAILVAGKTNAKKVIGVELQEDMYDMARRSVLLNKLEDRVEMINDNVVGISKRIGTNIDIVVCNPPYYKVTSGSTRQNECVSMARHEITLTLKDMIKSSSECLKYGGKFYLVHKAERLAEILSTLVEYKLEPKVLYNITTNDTNKVDSIIIECRKNGKSGMLVYNIKHD